LPNSENQTIPARVMKGEGPCTKPTSIALSKPVAEALGVKIGDAIQVKGSRSTVATVESIENMKEPVAYLGRTTRPNAGAHWDEHVQLSRLIAKKPAKKVVVGPPEAGTTLDADADVLKGILVGTYVTVGDLLEVGRRIFRPIFRGNNSVRFARIIVVETKPSGIIQIIPETELVVAREFREIEVRRSSATYDDIGGQREVTEKIRELVELPLRNPTLFKHLGVESPKGVLLHGPPGTGKTLLAKAVANESGAYFINIGASHLPAHDAERRLREVFIEAEQHAPGIIFIDEIDTIAPKREESFNPDDRRIVGALLELMDGMKERGQVIVMAATNRQNALDTALRRPGRFDREIEIPIPNEEGRLEILQIHSRYMPLDTDVDMKKLAENTPGYSGADIRLLCTEAAMSCVGRYRGKFNPDDTIPTQVLDEMKVNMGDFIEGSKRITPSCGREVIVEIPKVKWNQVGGYEKEKEEISKTVLTIWRNRQEAKKFGIRVSKGILLHGLPGVGKTFFAKAIAYEAGVKVINISGASLKSKWFGEYEHNIAKLFDAAKKAAPVVVIIDEVESLVPRRGGGLSEAGKTLDSGVNEFLRHIDGVLEIQDVFLICTTNRLDMIDPAFLRSGRVDIHFCIPKPDIEARAEIFKIHTATIKAPMNEDVDIQKLAKLTDGMTGADIEMIVRSAEREWFYDHIKFNGNPVLKLGMEYLLRPIEKAKTGLTANGREDNASLPF
jgi:transitional endoplasmic reticulum ATPase